MDPGLTGLIRMVQRGDGDMAFSALTITEQRKSVVDFSIPYYTEPPLLCNSKAEERAIEKCLLISVSVHSMGVFAVCVDHYVHSVIPGVQTKVFAWKNTFASVWECDAATINVW